MSRGRRSERGIFPRYSAREDAERELEAHVSLRAAELVEGGWDARDAEVEARRLLGDKDAIARECADVTEKHHRAVRRARVVEAMIQDLRYAVRTVLKSPAFSVVAVLTLALGIGANTAIFSVVNGVLLQPLPFTDAGELVVVKETRRQGGTMSVAWANFVDWREQNSVFDQIFAYRAGTTTVLGGESPVSTQVAVTSIDIWAALGVTPVVGRLTSDSDHVEGAAPVVLVSEAFWRSQLAARPLDELRLEVNGLASSVVGVLPGSFDFPTGTSIWQPMELLGQSDSRTAHNWFVAARTADGVSIDRANAEMDALTKRIVEAEGSTDDEFLAAGALVSPLREEIVGDARRPLFLLLGAAGLVLLVACTNLASTLLARGSNRSRELAVRASLGAGQSRLVRQLVTESTVIAAVGALAGLALGGALLFTLQRLGPEAVPRLQDVSIDGAVLTFTAAIAVGTVLLFGLFPAMRLTRADGLDVLRAGSRGNAGPRRGIAWTALVATEVALALVLLVGSGLLVRSFRTLLAEDVGFDASDVISTPVALSQVRYAEPADHAAFYRDAIEQLEALPDVEAAGVINPIPMGGFLANGRIELDGDVDKQTVAYYVVTSAGALEALDIPLLQGRAFDLRDTADQPHVAIVSESFAREVWPNESPLGRQVTGGGMDNFWRERTFAEVVGVVGDVRFRELGFDPGPTVFFPYTQRPFRIRFGATVLVEASSGDPTAVAGSLRSTLQRLDGDIPISLSTQRELIAESVAPREFTMMLLLGFSLVALCLAVVGIYGVVSYSVARRTREMGIRLALGADPGAVLRLVMRSAMRMVIGGLIVGIAASLGAGRVIQGMLYEVQPSDPLAIVAGVLVLAGAALVASWVPARAGTRVDPMLTMRAE